MADVSKIKLPNGTTYNIKDENALPLTGGSVTGPVGFGDSVSIDEATVGDLVVNGSASFTNGAHGVIDKAKAADVTSTLNALVKYEDTEGTFSDSNIYNVSNNLVIGSTSVPGNIQIGAKNDNYGILPNTNNYNQIGSSSLYWYRGYINNYYGLNSHVTNWDAGKNIGTSSTSSAAATLGSVYFYNACAAGGTQTKTLLSNGNAASNITVTLPNTTGTLALTSQIPDISGKADKATTLAGYGITDAKIASGVITLGSNTITPLTSSSTLSAAKLSGAIPSAVTATTQASTDNSTKIATTAYVTTAIANLPEPMVFKGSVGTGGTVTSLPTAAASNEGWTYKVITALSSPAAKVGDTVISNGSSWVVIPSGDEPSGTVTSVAASGSGGISISGSPITTSGTITIGLNLSTAINGLGEGTSPAHRDDYAVVQYAGGGTTTTTYHRRKLSNIFAALNKSDITTALGYTPPTSDTNTWRTIQVNGTDVLGSGTGTGKLNLKAGTNVSISNSSGTVTISSTDTNTWRGIQDNLTSTSTTESLSANQGRLLKNTKAEYRSIGSCADYQRVVIGLCELSANANSGTSSHTSGSIVSIRSNGLVPEYVSQFVFQDDYSTAKACNYSFIGNFENTSTTLRAGEGFRACTFTYNSKYYAGLEFYQTQARSFYWYGEGNFEPFLVAYYNFNTSAVLNTEINNSISLSTSVLKRRNIMADVSKVANSVAWSGVTGKPTATGSKVTGITASTTATKTTLGTAFTIPNVTSAGSASTWAFEEVSIPNVTSAGSASTWAFEDIACDDITSWSAGSGSASISGAVDSNDSTQLNITISHTHTAPSLQYTARTVSSKKSGANSTAPTLGTAIKVQSKKSGANGSAPTLGTAFTVPNVTGNTSATVSITDPGHTHSI